MKNSPHTIKQMNSVFSSYKNCDLKVNLGGGGARKKRVHFLQHLFCAKEFLFNIRFISMYKVLNKLSEYIYFYISKNITSYAFVACF